MQLWVARLTLVVYLIGGWIAPSIHNHASHGHGSHLHGSHVSHQAYAAVPQVSTFVGTKTTARACPCEHHHVSSAKQSSDAVPQLSIESIPFEHSACHGLCAVCLARSLTTHQIVEPLPSIVALVVASVHIQDTMFAEFDRVGLSLSRGPPTFV